MELILFILTGNKELQREGGRELIADRKQRRETLQLTGLVNDVKLTCLMLLRLSSFRLSLMMTGLGMTVVANFITASLYVAEKRTI